ncbi:DUF7149 domain-containing protein [Helicobacter kayseriensis]|uniref:DUF7149 domain-containing protein n=1 Tax=Helicobacter kayseriensis TaxID=2905877 RepID=UPI001E34819C|nr:hypothetical protein [Helicobacter kayseriensis]MCE3047386.1 hypothetical protein [Helicobacter kayseriensis]MCE3048757.1 hypothetical protein [Helicobacter kayseriensis]
MIYFKGQKLQDFIKSHSPKVPKDEDLKRFQANLSNFLDKATKRSDEEYQKKEIEKFLHQSFGYDCNTKGRIDSAIYVEGEAQVLIEVKSLANKAEFPKSPQDLHSKAFYEAILYFLRETQKEQNPSSPTQELESQINSLVYSLYNLTPEEIGIIEGEK